MVHFIDGTSRTAEEKQTIDNTECTLDCEPNKGDITLTKDVPPETIEDVNAHTTRRLDIMEGDGCDDSTESGVPKIGMVFESESCAFEFYNEYARKIGFSVRRGGQRKRASGTVQMKRFLCFKEGFCKEPNLAVQRKKKRGLERTGCNARMEIKLQENGKYYINSFALQHNHILASPHEVHLLRSQRSVSEVQAIEADNLDKAGIRPKNAYTYMQRTAGGRQNLGYLPIDLRNHLHGKRKRALEKGVAGSLLEHFALMQVMDPGFFYAFQVDEDDLLTNVFWTDSRMRQDYETFGDVVCFDTTFATNNECRPFAPFVGVNHHRNTIIFGACFLYDETADSFVWVFNTFLTAMSGKQPKTILTDQDKAMAKAIASTFPNTIHRICIWHMYQNAAKNLQDIFNTREGFKQDFGACVFDFDDEEDFLEAWDNLLEKYKLRNNEWLKRLYKEKEKWALVYGRDTFCADMKSTQRSERMNRTLKGYLHITHDLMRFFEHFQRMLDDLRNNELESDFKSSQSAMSLYTPVKKLKVASTFYTRAIFQEFLKEFMNSHDLRVDDIVEDDRVSKYTIENVQRHRKHIVLFNLENNIASCGCRKFEFVGIICCHLLKVYERRDIMDIPSHFFLKRWSKDAKSGIKIDVLQYKENEKIENPGRRYHLLSRKAIKLSTRAAESKDTFLYINQMMDKALHDVDHRLSKERVEEQCSNHTTSLDVCQQSIINVDCNSQSPHEDNIQIVKGFKHKEIKKRGAKRNPSCLERCNGSRNKKKKDRHAGNIGQTPQAISYNANLTCPLASQENPSSLCNESLDGVSQFSQSSIQECENTHTFRETYHANGLQHPSFLSYLGVFPGAFSIPMSDMSIPSIVSLGGPSTVHIEPSWLTNNLGGHLPPPNSG